jgi:hypothetical protein
MKFIWLVKAKLYCKWYVYENPQKKRISAPFSRYIDTLFFYFKKAGQT